MNSVIRCTLVLAAMAVWTGGSVDLASAQLFDDSRVWVSRDGARRVEGTLTEVNADKTEVTVVRSDNQKQVRVLIDKLSATDYLYVRDYIRRSASQAGSSELAPIPMAISLDDQTSQRWLLKPAISIELPAPTGIWKVLMPQPIFFAGYATDAPNERPAITVLYEPKVIEPSEKVARIQEANYATKLFLEERGVTHASGSPFQEDASIPTQYSRVGGLATDGSELFCDTLLRWDHDKLLVIRIIGNPTQVAEYTDIVSRFEYVEDDQPSLLIDMTEKPDKSANAVIPPDSNAQPPVQPTEEPKLADAATAPAATPVDLPPADIAATGEPTAESEPTIAEPPAGDSRVPKDIRLDFDVFHERAVTLLKKTNNAQEVIEKLAHPDGLKRLKQNRERWESAIIAFDVRKRKRLLVTLQTLDWTTAEYVPEERRLSFQLPDTIEFVKAEHVWHIVN